MILYFILPCIYCVQAGPVDTAIQVLLQEKPLGHDCQPASNLPKLAYLVLS
jgi:hypothetical protein